MTASDKFMALTIDISIFNSWRMEAMTRNLLHNACWMIIQPFRICMYMAHEQIDYMFTFNSYCSPSDTMLSICHSHNDTNGKQYFLLQLFGDSRFQTSCVMCVDVLWIVPVERVILTEPDIGTVNRDIE